MSAVLLGAKQFFASRPKPYDAEVEYIESTGTQWIDTGVYGDQNTVAELVAASVGGKNGNQWGFGSRIAWANCMFALYNGQDQGYRYVFGYGQSSSVAAAVSSTPSDDGVLHTFVIASPCSVDGSALPIGDPANSAFQTPTHLIMFGAYANGGLRLGTWRFASCKIFKSGELALDFIPVRFTNEQGQTEGAMYDRVSKQLFRNQGTDAFIIGSDK